MRMGKQRQCEIKVEGISRQDKSVRRQYVLDSLRPKIMCNLQAED